MSFTEKETDQMGLWCPFYILAGGLLLGIIVMGFSWLIVSYTCQRTTSGEAWLLGILCLIVGIVSMNLLHAGFDRLGMFASRAYIENIWEHREYHRIQRKGDNPSLAR